MKELKNVKKFKVDYEGIGTHVEANVSINGKLVCIISSNSIHTNARTVDVVEFLKNAIAEKFGPEVVYAQEDPHEA